MYHRSIISKGTTHYADELLQGFCNEKRTYGREEKTIKIYEETINYFLSSVFNSIHIPVEEITQESLETFINKAKERGVRVTSINSYLHSLGVFINWLKEKGLTNVKVKFLPTQEPLPKHFTDEEINKLLKKPTKTASFTEWRSYTIACFILATGARPATIRNIKIEDVSFSAGEIQYRHVKTKHAMSVPISPSLCNSLREYLHLFNIDGYLFPSVENKQLTENALKLSFKKYRKKNKTFRI